MSMSAITEQDIAANRFEVTHHMTGHNRWYPAKVVKVRPNFVDVLRDGMSTPIRYNRKTGEEHGDYCGFKSTVRAVR